VKAPTSSRPGVFALLKTTASDWMDDGALRLSAALAYYSIFSIAPLIVITIGVAGWFFGADAVRGELEGQLRGLLGPRAAEAVQSMVQSASRPSQSKWATIIGLATLLLGASGVFGQLKDALNTIWKVKARSGLGVWPFIRERLLSFGMVLVIGFLLLISLVLTTVLSAFNRWIERVLQLPDWLWGGAGLIVSFAVVTLLFAVIYKVLPDVEMEWRFVWAGAAATALLFELGKFLLGWYLGREGTSSSYGAAGSVILVLLWIYYASCILLFGAEFTKVFAAAHGAAIRPSHLSEPVTSDIRLIQGMAPLKPEPVPAHESLPRVFPKTYFPEPQPGTPLPLQQRLERLVRTPAGSTVAALGCGLLLGLVTRRRDRSVS